MLPLVLITVSLLKGVQSVASNVCEIVVQVYFSIGKTVIELCFLIADYCPIYD